MAFMQWFKIYADLQHHPKRWRFEELANTEYGLHYLTAWFSYVCKFASNGDISGFTPKQVARACEWNGDPQVFWDALVGAGFIDQTEAGLVAHDWYEENGRFIRENERKKEPKGNPREPHGKPKGNPCDSTVQDSTKTPSADADDGFNAFWAAYPKKAGKIEAAKQWRIAKPPLDAVLKAIEEQKKSRQWLDGFILDPERWIKRGHWMNETNQTFDPATHFPDGRKKNVL